jgi:hypothetical protein
VVPPPATPPIPMRSPAARWPIDAHADPRHHREKAVSAHHVPVIALGGLVERRVLLGQRQVAAVDVRGRHGWIDAAAVWTDGERCRPEHPQPVGLAAAHTWADAVLSGLSDRLGWEALEEWQHGLLLPAADALGHRGSDGVRFLDGRLHHGLPTVVALSARGARWGAGATWESALGRAWYGREWPADRDELPAIEAMLSSEGLGIAAVELGSSVLCAHHLVRVSVQLATRPGR